MNRRQVLATSGATLVLPFAGCAATRDDSRTTDARKTTDSTTNPTTDIVIEVSNATAVEETVHLRVASDGESIFEESVTVEPDERTYVDPGLDERGEYELAATVDDEREVSFPFRIEEYDLQTGSNLIVNVREDDLDILIEE